jgi:hypothetical protein
MNPYYALIGIQAFGDILQGYSENQALKLQARLERQEGAFKEQARRDIGESIKSSQRAGFGASGVDISSRSGRTPAAVISATVRDTELDALAIRYASENRSKLLRYQGKQSKISSLFKAGSHILGGLI